MAISYGLTALPRRKDDMESKSWFEVDVKGLRALQEGKPKHYVLRELIANAFDENIKICRVYTNFIDGTASITVIDDSPEGFKNLRDAYTLFGDSSKRRDVSKRGRFNAGDKFSIALADCASIKTTKGSVIFSETGRSETKEKTINGSIVEMTIKMTNEEYGDMLRFIQNYLPPKGIVFKVNNCPVEYSKPLFIVEDTLPTQNEIDGQLRDTQRKTEIHIHKREVNFLYEMGIPIIEIDCPYSIDIQQKVPMSVDRESVKPSYLKQVFAIVLNKTIDDIDDEKSSESWIRIGSGAKQIVAGTLQKLIKMRFGDKIVVSNPRDPIANDDALAHGFRVIQGRELSAEEWDNIKEHGLIQSSTEVFGRGSATDVKSYIPDENMKMVKKLAQKIAKEFLGIDITVDFFTSEQASIRAMYGDRNLCFNVTKLGKNFFENPVSVNVLDILVHEICHENGMHTEENYHRSITRMAGELTIMALKNPKFFDIKEMK
jgi:hypothetical protein